MADVDNVVKSTLPVILDGTYFEVVKQEGKKISVKCKLCPNKLLSAQTDATSNLLKHLKVNNFRFPYLLLWLTGSVLATVYLSVNYVICASFVQG